MSRYLNYFTPRPGEGRDPFINSTMLKNGATRSIALRSNPEGTAAKNGRASHGLSPVRGMEVIAS
jgi:hypothetical protein